MFFRGKRGHLIKILWHDGIGMSLYAKRLERGRFLWPSPADGIDAISAAQWPICSTALTGGTRFAPGVQKPLAEGRGTLTHLLVERRQGLGNIG
jgi:transposase